MATPSFITAAPETPRTVLRGIALYLVGIAVAATMDVFIKLLAIGAYPTGQIVFARAAVALVPLLVVVALRNRWRALLPRSWKACLARGVVQTGAASFFFLAFAYLPLADAYAIGFTAPLMIAALSGPLLGERVGLLRWAAIIAGFSGVLVMLRPGQAAVSDDVWIGAAAALIGAFFYALAVVLIRRIGRTETTWAIAFTTNLAMAACAVLTLPFGWTVPDAEGLVLLLLVGLCGGIMTLLLTEAFRTAPSAVIAPFEYTAMICGIGFGFLVFGDVPTMWLFLGTAIVIASGLAVVRAEVVGRRVPPS